MDPYMRPLYDALFDMMDRERTDELMERGVIEIAPLAYMRGRTLSDAFVVLDEAQNTTPEQMKMFLTRLGFNSKFVITGDLSQRDLVGRRGGLADVEQIFGSCRRCRIFSPRACRRGASCLGGAYRRGIRCL